MPRHKTNPYECPKKCSGKGSSRQRSLKPGELREITGVELNGREKRCMYCGCVYRHLYREEAIEILGWYDDPMGRQGWTLRKPSEMIYL